MIRHNVAKCVFNLILYSVIIKSQMNCFSYFQSLLGLEFLNSNKSGDMADILKSFHDQYVPIKDGEVLYKTVMHGDQLTEERARNVQWTYKNGETSAERLEGLEPTFSEFHLKMCLFEVRCFFSVSSDNERTIILLIELD